MASNYFSFAPGTAPYSAQAATYQPAAQAYIQTAQTAYAAAARPAATATYEYQGTQNAYAYRPAVTAAANYDSKAYYQAAAVAAPAVATSYSVAEYPSAVAAAAQNTAKTQPTPAAVSTYTYSAASTNTNAGAATTTSASNTGYSGYDAALYSAATNYYQQQQQQTKKTATNWHQYKKTSAGGPASNVAIKKKPGGPPKNQQMQYCEVCKISCAGPQTFKEHLEGQKHKKKAQQMSASSTAAAAKPTRGGSNQLHCELCDVTCTGSDAYAAHIRGAKHQKVMKLHARLGKPIPSETPKILGGQMEQAQPIPTKVGSSSSTTGVVKKVLSSPKISFVGGTTLKTTGNKAEEVKAAGQGQGQQRTEMAQAQAVCDLVDEIKLASDVQPVGHEYIEEVQNMGKIVSFQCKLCDCKFNDPNAKEMHLKGRRHRLQYKKKVDPSLKVEVKPSIKARKVQEERVRRATAKEEYWRRKEQEQRWREQMRMEEERYWDDWQMRSMGSGPGGRRPETSDDRHVMAKHNSIYPTEQELHDVQSIVSSCERGLKLVSDYLAENCPKKEEESVENKDDNTNQRLLKGVMRVGVLAKGLLLQGDVDVELVVLCSEKPTNSLLDKVADNLLKQLPTVSEEHYEVRRVVEEAALIVKATGKEKSPVCTVTFTAPCIREENEESVSKADPPDVLNRQKCLDALAALRHTKWFQAKAAGMQTCVILIRVLRDLCQRVPTWIPLNQWAMELLVEKCIATGGPHISVGDGLRRVFECIASGVLLPKGPGLYDPCEKEPSDAAEKLSPQEREDITASAQHALRLIAFKQIHKVLGMEQLVVKRPSTTTNPRKRRLTASNSELEEGGTEKKDKKDDEDNATDE